MASLTSENGSRNEVLDHLELFGILGHPLDRAQPGGLGSRRIACRKRTCCANTELPKVQSRGSGLVKTEFPSV